MQIILQTYAKKIDRLHDSVATTLPKQMDENVRDQIFTGVIKQVQKVSMK